MCTVAPTAVSLQLSTDRPELLELARLTRQRLGERCRDDARWTLFFDDAGAELLGPGDQPGQGVRAASRRPAKIGKKQPFARALGPPGGLVVDATGGLGEDALMMFSLGHQVQIVERSPIAFALLESAVVCGRLPFEVYFGDAKELMAQRKPQVVYMDPMFPPKKKRSALPPKGARYLGKVIGPDADTAELLLHARQAAKERVVVKRPDHAPPVSASPRASYEGKLVRFDVYEPE